MRYFVFVRTLEYKEQGYVADQLKLKRAFIGSHHQKYKYSWTQGSDSGTGSFSVSVSLGLLSSLFWLECHHIISQDVMQHLPCIITLRARGSVFLANFNNEAQEDPAQVCVAFCEPLIHCREGNGLLAFFCEGGLIENPHLKQKSPSPMLHAQ